MSSRCSVRMRTVSSTASSGVIELEPGQVFQEAVPFLTDDARYCSPR